MIISTGFRSVPLITVLFHGGDHCCRIFFTGGHEFNSLLKSGGVCVCFAARNMGREHSRRLCRRFQKAQYEAAATLGLGYLHTMVFWLILPSRPLKMMIPISWRPLFSCWKTRHIVSILLVYSTQCWCAKHCEWQGLGGIAYGSPWWWFPFCSFCLVLTGCPQTAWILKNVLRWITNDTAHQKI